MTLFRSLHYEALHPRAAVRDLPRGPYAEVRVEFHPATLRSKGIVSTNAPPRPTDFKNTKFFGLRGDGSTLPQLTNNVSSNRSFPLRNFYGLNLSRWLTDQL